MKRMDSLKKTSHEAVGVVALAILVFGLGISLCEAQPANDMFANRIVLTGTNITIITSSVGATQEPGDPLIPYAIGGASVWWSWTAPFDGVVTISTAGSSFDTVLWVLTGTSLSALTGIAYNDEDPDGGTSTSKLSFHVEGGQTYQMEVDGYFGESGDVHLQLNLQPLSSAPAWALPDPYGVTVSSSSFAGKVVLLDFWATWCNPCKAEIPDLVALQDKYRADGLVIVGADVSWSGDTSQVVQSFLSTFSPMLNYQIVMSNSGYEAAFGSIGSVPTTYIIDRQNKIRNEYVGTQLGSTLERAIIPLLYTSMCLGCTRSGNQMTFRWPATAQAFTLESALTPTGSWSTWPTGPTVINGTNTVQIAMTNSTRCFRLRLPY